MKIEILQIKLLVLGLLLALPTLFAQEMPNDGKQLWYRQPASQWMEALPIGNGRLGAMVFGGTGKERLQLNEDSLWPGGPDWGDSKGDVKDLEEIRHLLKEGKKQEADSLIVERFSYKSTLRSHQTMGDLILDFGTREVTNYRRELDLDSALVSVTYISDGNQYTEEVFASAEDDILVLKLSTNAPQGMSFDIDLSRPKDHGNATVKVSNPSEDEISMKGMVTQYGGIKDSKPFPLDYGVKFETLLKAISKNGKVTSNDGKLYVENAKSVTILISAKTSFYQKDFEAENRKTIAAASGYTYKKLKQRHIADYRTLYDRVALDLGGDPFKSIPTDQRLDRVKEGNADLGLVSLLFQFGRYLLIASSREGTNPANLQGLWNEHIEAPWNADYHVNINLQMNYWPAEVTNLSELHEPLFRFTDRLIERGRKTAKEQYGINRGAVVHHTSDLWATTFMRAEQPYWGAWIHGGGWLSRQYWEHYLYTQDTNFLKKEAYPALKAFSEFYLDWLVKDERTGTLVSAPETSPENSYVAKNGKPAATSFGNAMGHQIIADVFGNFLAAAKVLGIQNELTAEVRSKLAKLQPGVVIGKDGRILEWDEPYEETEPGHRHMSHLYALHPDDVITPKDKEAFAAAKKTIDFRLKHGGAGTGWSRAWMINMDARLMDGDAAGENAQKFLEISVADNLFDMHPPFQIDGNFGFTAGVAEMLLQSHQGFLEILPALPETWQKGKTAGLKARGNIEVRMEWEQGELTKLGLLAQKAGKYAVKYKNKDFEVKLPKGRLIWVKKDEWTAGN